MARKLCPNQRSELSHLLSRETPARRMESGHLPSAMFCNSCMDTCISLPVFQRSARSAHRPHVAFRAVRQHSALSFICISFSSWTKARFCFRFSCAFNHVQADDKSGLDRRCCSLSMKTEHLPSTHTK